MSDVPTEQPGSPDSATSIDDKLDRFFEGPEEEVQQPADTQAAEQPQEQPQEAPDESEEDFDYEGLKLRLPREAATKLKSAVEGYKDYTRKTQEVADARRMVELHTQQRHIEGMFQQSAQQEFSQLAELEAAIKQYQNVPWQTLDTDTLVKTKHAYDTLKEQRTEIQRQLQIKQQQFGQQLEAVKQELGKKAEEALSRSIPKWSPETQSAILSYGQSKGFSENEIAQLKLDPRLMKTFWQAQQWEQLQSAKPLAAKRAMGVPPVVRPGATKQVASAQAQYADTLKQLHQAKDPGRKKELLDRSIDLKLDRMFKN